MEDAEDMLAGTTVVERPWRMGEKENKAMLKEGEAFLHEKIQGSDKFGITKAPTAKKSRFADVKLLLAKYASIGSPMKLVERHQGLPHAGESHWPPGTLRGLALGLLPTGLYGSFTDGSTRLLTSLHRVAASNFQYE